MKLLVTGAQGQVGAELIRRGQGLGFEMIPASHADLDITSEGAISAFLGSHSPDMVINGAAYTAVDKAETDDDNAHAINTQGVAHLAQVCRKQNIPLLHISTDYVFDGQSSNPYQEDDKPNPQGVYGVSKLAGDIAVVQTMEKYIILRVAWVFGACGQNFVRTMLRLGAEHDALRVVADQLGGPTWAGDIAKTLLIIARRYDEGESIPWGTYHYTGVPVVSWFDFAQAIFTEAVNLGMLEHSPEISPITTAEYPTPAKRPQNSVLNCYKIQQNLGIKQPDWHIGLQKTLQEWQEQ